MKPFIVMQGPVATRSGYGNHMRDLAMALISSDKYDIAIVSLPWGSCPMNALNAQDENHKLIIDKIITTNINKQPDIFIQLSVPHEFQKIGKYNIGVTAGIETNQCSTEWLEGCNRMDLIITTSKHSKDVFTSTAYDKINEQTKKKEAELKLTTPIEILFEGCDLNIYHKTDKLDRNVVDELIHIKEDFCYLFVGHWLQGGFGQDRKDVGMLIKTFCETFKKKVGNKRPALILKTSGAGFSIIDREYCLNRIRDIIREYGPSGPNVYLLHGDFTDKEMNSLYNHPKMKVMVSFTKGEGFGRPLLEFGMTGKPIVASNWSGHVDFLNPDYCMLLSGQLTEVHKSVVQDKMIIKGSKWFTVNYGYASQIFADIHKKYKDYLVKSRKQPEHVRKNFTFKQMQEKFVGIIDDIVAKIPSPVSLNLPKLKKVGSGNNEPIKIKLPKLKKIEV
jgi:glycosyltransferase involved in cell wall biosynthesis